MSCAGEPLGTAAAIVTPNTRVYSRNTDIPLARIMAVELHPRVVHGVVTDRKRVDSSPQAPAGPLADVRLGLAGDNEDDEIADLRDDDGRAAAVCAIAEPRKEENDEQREGRANGCKRVG